MKYNRLSTSSLVYNLLIRIENLILSVLLKRDYILDKYLFGRLGMTYDYEWMDRYYFNGKTLSYMLKY